MHRSSNKRIKAAGVWEVSLYTFIHIDAYGQPPPPHTHTHIAVNSQFGISPEAAFFLKPIPLISWLEIKLLVLKMTPVSGGHGETEERVRVFQICRWQF